ALRDGKLGALDDGVDKLVGHFIPATHAALPLLICCSWWPRLGSNQFRRLWPARRRGVLVGVVVVRHRRGLGAVGSGGASPATLVVSLIDAESARRDEMAGLEPATPCS